MTEWANLRLERLIAREHASGERVAALARKHGRSRSGIYALLERCRHRERHARRRAKFTPQPPPAPQPLADPQPLTDPQPLAYCDGDTVIDAWPWQKILDGHAKYPAVPKHGERYPL